NWAGDLQPMQNYVLAANIYDEPHVGAGVTSPNVGPILVDDELSFNYRIVTSSLGEAVDPSAGSVDVFISTDFGQNYTLLTNFAYGESPDWQTFSMPLDSYLGELVKLKLAVNYNFQ